MVADSDALDQFLVQQLRSGSDEAAAQLLQLYGRRLFGYCFRIMGNYEDAEDVASASILKAWKYAAQFRGDGCFRLWLFRIARNVARDRLRQPRLPMLELRECDGYQAEIGAEAAVRADVRAALTALPNEQQEALLLCDVEEWDAAEAAELLGRSVQATKSLLYRARRSMRTKLVEGWSEE